MHDPQKLYRKITARGKWDQLPPPECFVCVVLYKKSKQLYKYLPNRHGPEVVKSFTTIYSNSGTRETKPRRTSLKKPKIIKAKRKRE